MIREMRELRKTEIETYDQHSEYESICISSIRTTTYKQVRQYLDIKLEPAKWEQLPNDIQDVDDRSAGFFRWLPDDENSPANRTAYMEYLNSFSWPEGFGLVDLALEKDLLCSRFADFSFSGTIDVALATLGVIREDIVEYNILLGIELKKPVESKETYHSQIVMQHLCAARQNPDTGVLTLLTDLNKLWCFFWFGRPRKIFKRTTSIAQAKFLLKNLFNSEVEGHCPEAFHSRLSWNDCFSSNQRKKGSRF